MTKDSNKRPWSRGRKVLMIALALLVIAAGAIWYVFSLKFNDTAEERSVYTVSDMELLDAYKKDPQAANARYTEQIITVKGTVAEVEPVDTTVNIKFVDTATGAYIIFAFQQQHLEEAKALKVGDKVAIKGSCSGGAYSEILETVAVNLKRCAVER